MTNATNVTLLPCPFCGGEAKATKGYFKNGWHPSKVICKAGHVFRLMSPIMEEKRQQAEAGRALVTAWNTRTAAEAASKAEMTELVAHTQALIQLAIDGGLTHDLMAQLGYGAKAANGQPADAFAKRARRTVNEARALLAKHQTEGRG